MEQTQKYTIWPSSLLLPEAADTTLYQPTKRSHSFQQRSFGCCREGQSTRPQGPIMSKPPIFPGLTPCNDIVILFQMVDALLFQLRHNFRKAGLRQQKEMIDFFDTTLVSSIMKHSTKFIRENKKELYVFSRDVLQFLYRGGWLTGRRTMNIYSF